MAIAGISSAGRMGQRSRDIVFVLWTFAGIIHAEESGKIGAGSVSDSLAVHYQLRIGQAAVGPDSPVDTVAIVLNSADTAVAGFSLKVGLDNPSLRIEEILPGAIIDSCGWELFGPRDVSMTRPKDAPEQLWSIVGLAKASGDKSVPNCYSLRGENTICSIVLSYESIPGIEDTAAYVSFYWQNCRDNLLTDISGSRLSISRHVLEFNGDTLVNETDNLPSSAGTPESCFDSEARNHPKRVVDFQNGLVRIEIESPR